MYTGYIGYKLLNKYNSVKNRNFTAKEFFELEMFPVFFQKDSFFMHVTNSAFAQRPNKVIMEKNNCDNLTAQLIKMQEDIENNIYHMGTYVGGPSLSSDALTSGQASADMDIDISEDDYYASWIGQACSIAVGAGYVVFIDDEDFLYMIYEGWQKYRDFLTANPQMKDKQLETWNGYWLKTMSEFDYHTSISWAMGAYETRDIEGGKKALKCKNWSLILFYLSTYFNKNTINVYCHNLGKFNKTIGFVTVDLKNFSELYKRREKLYEVAVDNQDFNIFTPISNFKDACMKGEITIEDLKPNLLDKCLRKGFKFETEQDIKDSLIVKAWIMSILGKEELFNLAEDLAKILVTFESNNKKGKTKRGQMVKDVLESKNITRLLLKLTAIAEMTEEQYVELIENITETVSKVEQKNVYLFNALIQYNYNLIKTK